MCFSPYFFFLSFFKKYLFIWLCQALVVACGLTSCGMWDLVPWSGIKPAPPTLGLQSLSHWTTTEVPWCLLTLWSKGTSLSLTQVWIQLLNLKRACFFIHSTLPQLPFSFPRGHCKNICSYSASALPLLFFLNLQFSHLLLFQTYCTYLLSKYLLIDWLVLHNTKGLLTLFKK